MNLFFIKSFKPFSFNLYFLKFLYSLHDLISNSLERELLYPSKLFNEYTFIFSY